MKKNAFRYLNNKRGKKGEEIEYSCLEMCEYLLPTNNILTIEQKREMFAIRNRMIDIPNNFLEERNIADVYVEKYTFLTVIC